MTKILIIDDDQLFCRLMEVSMNFDGKDILCANTLEDGLRILQSENVDVVFLDVKLPDGNGLDRLVDIRACSSKPEVIIITGAGTPDGAELAIESGAWDYIQKPSPLGDIKLHLMRALQYREEKKREKKETELKLEGIIGSGARMQDCFRPLAEAAATDINVLITGETGTGKELFAKAIHMNSHRANNNFVVVDCATLQDTLKESALFGYEKGAFTGADRSHEGLIKQADGGTLFLDEVGELPLPTQRVFLRVLEERRFRPLGLGKEIESNFRLIAATNRDLDGMVQLDQFRDDLLYRIRSHTIALPPLREHKEDIVEIALYHAERICKRSGLVGKNLSPDMIDALLAYDWPGNNRELVNALERAIASAMSAPTLFRRHLPNTIRVRLARSSVDEPGPENNAALNAPARNIPNLKELRESTYAEVEKKYLRDLVKITGGDMAQACVVAQLSQPRLYELLRKHKISTKV